MDAHRLRALALSGYDLETRWQIAAPPERVWDTLRDAAGWAGWWPGLQTAVVLVAPRPDGTGEVQWCRWRAPLGYSVAFEVTSTRVERPSALEGVARGDLAGSGAWALSPAPGGGTDVRFRWRVEVATPWLRRAGVLARPLLLRGHHALMRAGEAGLRERLGGTPPSRAPG